MSPMDQELSTEHDKLQKIAGDFLRFSGRKYGAKMIAKLEEERLFKRSERVILHEEIARARTLKADAFPRKSLTLVFKVTRLCSLRCEYCNSWGEGPGNVMPFRTAVRATLEALLSMNAKKISFVWHGGEVTLLSPNYIKKMLWVQERFRRKGVIIQNAIQTNAVSISDEWFNLLTAVPLSLGVSVDGPEILNDQRRRLPDGSGSSAAIERSIQRLRAEGIPFGLLIVVDRTAASYGPRFFLDWLLEIGVPYVDFLNVAPSHHEIQQEAYDSHFMPVDEFAEWLADVYRVATEDPLYKGIKIRLTEDIAQALRTGGSLVQCYFSGRCFSDVLTVNPDGSVSPCDKYVTFPNIAYGRLQERSLADVAVRGAALNDSEASFGRLSGYGPKCRWQELCKGGCPHDTHVLQRYRNVDLGCCGLQRLFDAIEQRIAANRV